MRFIPRTIIPDTGVSVSTATIIYDWNNLGGEYYQILFYLVNNDLTNACTLIIETSEDGVHPDINATSIVIPPGNQGSLEIGPEQLRRFWRLTAHSPSPGYPDISVTWGSRGCERLV